MPINFRTGPISEPLAFDSIGNHWPQEDVFRPKGHALYHYLQSEEGAGRIVIQGKEYTLDQGEGVLIAPFIHHAYSKKTERWLTSFATFIGTLENSISKIVGNKPVIFIEREEGKKISSILADGMKKYESHPVDTKSLSIDCYCLLMHFVGGVYNHDLLNEPLYIQYVSPVIKEIETLYDTQITVQELSSSIYITPQYLSRLFRRFLGCSVYEYLTTYRMNKAKEMLLMNSKMEVQLIAQQVGFSDTSHFIAIFKKVTGYTPLEFRRLN